MSLLGSTIGRIRLIDLAGKGGMGEVFVGYDETLERKVAVKCVSPRFRLNQTVTGRILREARILSRLDHPNICQIYDFVRDDQGDFLVMELVRGQSLGKAVESGLDDKTKLRIAVQIADVLVATHAEGVIHRDLKPDNVMITDSGEVKVLDFGIARSPEADEISTFDPGKEQDPSPESRFTRDGTLIQGSIPWARESSLREDVRRASNLAGTPRYMSPEQAKSEPNTPASDMYSFGLLLQELFTERSPLDRHPLPALMVEVSEGRSRPVEGLGKDLTRLIERLKSLNPSQRPTAKEAADRLRWIRDSPKRWLRRGLIVATILMVCAAVGKYTLDLQHERESALEARNQAMSARDQAEDLVAFMLEDLSGELRPTGQLEVLEKVARQALDYYGQDGPESVGDAAFLRGTAFRHAGEVLADQGELEPALDALTSAERIHRELVAGTPEGRQWQIALATDLMHISQVYRMLGHRDEADRHIQEALQISARQVELWPDDTASRESLAEANYTWGLGELFRNNTVAEQAFETSIELYQELSAQHPENGNYKFLLAVLHGQGLGQMYALRDQPEESFAAVQKAYAAFEELTSGETFNARWLHGFAWENRRMGEHFAQKERWSEALTYYQKANEITRRLLEFEPSQADWRLGLGYDYSSIGHIYQRQGRLDEALVSYQQSLDVCEQLLATEPAHTEHISCQVSELVSIGTVWAAKGEAARAKEIWERAEELSADFAVQLEQTDDYILEARASALIYLGRIEDARVLVKHLQETGWIDSTTSTFVELCRDNGLLP